MSKYPDITDLIALKAARRKKLATLPIVEKFAIAQTLQEIGRSAPGWNAPKKREGWRLGKLRTIKPTP